LIGASTTCKPKLCKYFISILDSGVVVAMSFS
jgi:hypothetical protein